MSMITTVGPGVGLFVVGSIEGEADGLLDPIKSDGYEDGLNVGSTVGF